MTAHAPALSSCPFAGLLLALLLTIAPSVHAAEGWREPRFVVAYENFAWGTLRRGIMVDDAGQVYSFNILHRESGGALCDPRTLVATADASVYTDFGNLWKEPARAEQVTEMAALAQQAKKHFPYMANSAAADTGLGCFFYFSPASERSYSVRYLLSVGGDLSMEPGSPEAVTISEWLRGIIARVDWSEEGKSRKQRVR